MHAGGAGGGVGQMSEILPGRENIVAGLAAMRGADIALCSYAETHKTWDLAAALDAGRRLVTALEQETYRRENAERKKKMLSYKSV